MTCDFQRPAARLCLVLAALWLGLWPVSGQGADRARIEAFLNVTGFDVALDSIAFSAASAPQMVGRSPADFGADWSRLADRVFDRGVMREMALDLLEKTLSDEMLNHAAAFYASDLGQRLVIAENASHAMEDDTQKQAEGLNIIADLVARGASRLEVIKRMNAAIDSSGNGLRAVQEIQLRFLLAASAAGVIEMQFDEESLRAALKGQEAQVRMMLQQSMLTGSAFTYRDIEDRDLVAYAEALEHPMMSRVYELLNAVQYEIMANRFEVLAVQMAKLHPSQDL